MPIYFVGTTTTDLEERIEEDRLCGALVNEFPDLIHVVGEDVPAGAVAFGRLSWRQILHGDLVYPTAGDLKADYWRWPAFIRNARRRFELCTFAEACDLVAEIHETGKGAFVKATDDKLLTMPVHPGMSLASGMGDMAYSFIDRKPCLMVQEYADIRYEYRFLVVDGKLVTGAGQITELTPDDNEALFDPKVRASIREVNAIESRPELIAAYQAFAERVLPELPQPSLSLDVATINGEIGIVECNPMQPGRLGLFSSDVRAFAKALAASPTIQARINLRLAEPAGAR